MKNQVIFFSVHNIFFLYIRTYIYNPLITQCIYRGSSQMMKTAWIHSGRTTVIHTENYILNVY